MFFSSVLIYFLFSCFFCLFFTFFFFLFLFFFFFIFFFFFFFSSRRRHTRLVSDWSSDCALPILGAEEALAAKRALGWPEQPAFLVPDDVRGLFTERAAALRRDYEAWHAALKRWRAAHADRAALWDQLVERRVPPDGFERLVANAPAGP